MPVPPAIDGSVLAFTLVLVIGGRVRGGSPSRLADLA